MAQRFRILEHILAKKQNLEGASLKCRGATSSGRTFLASKPLDRDRRGNAVRIDQIMSKRVHTCQPDDSLERAAQLMWDFDCGAVAVCTGNGASQTVGIVTDRDIAMSALLKGQPLRDLYVKDTMSRDVLTCRPDDSLAEAEQRMRSGQVRRLPVVNDQGAVIGMISLADLAQEAMRECGEQSKEITENEVGDTLAAICAPRTQESPITDA
ncbi:CBS domain-containing protein [Methylolobus aquaticus]